MELSDFDYLSIISSWNIDTRYPDFKPVSYTHLDVYKRQALNDYEAAKRTYEASRRTAAATQLAYNNMKTKYDLGSANTFELVSSKNRWDIAKVEEILGRYELIFRSKVIDYYLGRPVNLN